jgi:Squalene-hopene cyclase C-terminal domain
VSWQLGSFALLGLALGGGFVWYERSRPPARLLSLVAALAALAVVGRLAFAAIPNVKPTTDIVLFAGLSLGAAPGFAVGAVAALVSNLFLSEGPWTVWQMAAWGGVGIAGAALGRATGRHEIGRLPLALVCGVAGLGFGAFMDVYQWTLAARQDLPSYLAVSGTSLPYNLAHAIGNVVFCLLIGPAFVRALRRYRRRFEVRWPEPARVAAGLALALAVAGGLAAPGRAEASVSGRAARYLDRAQNRDGGFGAQRGASSSQLFTGWAALGLAAAGQNPRDVHRPGGRSVVTYLRRHTRGLNDVGELERTILLLRASGLSPRRFAGRDLVARLSRHRRSDGSIDTVNHTAFGVLALRAAGVGSGALARSASYLERAQNPDGGFGFVTHAGSDVDDTGAVLQALVAAERGAGSAAARAVSYIERGQNGDGGFGQMQGDSSNAQSTAWAVQGLVAGRRGRGAVARAIRYLARLQRRGGSVRYSRTSAQTPVWVTAQSLAALRRKPFPLRPVPRNRPRHHARLAAAAPAGAAPRSASAPRASSRRSGRARAEARSAPVRPRAVWLEDPRVLRGADLPAAGSRPASERTGPEGSAVPPAAVVGGACVLALAAAGAARWHLRRRHRPRGPEAPAQR